MKAFVTGGTGYIGSRLIRRLLETGHEVVALYRNEVPDFRHKRLAWKQGALKDKEALTAQIAGCDRVYHVAALAKMWHPQKEAFFDVNVRGTQIMLQASQRAGVEKFVFTSSASVLSASFQSPVSESDPQTEPFDDDYGITKYIAEKLVMKTTQPGFKTVVVIPPRVYGPSDRGTSAVNKLVSGYINKPFYFVPGYGNFIGNYAFIEDVVNGHLMAMEYGKPGARYIIGGENHSYNSFYQVLGEITEKKRKRIGIPYSMMQVVACMSELKTRITNREPAITMSMVNKIYSNRKLSCYKAINEIGYTITPLCDGLATTYQYLQLKPNK